MLHFKLVAILNYVTCYTFCYKKCYSGKHKKTKVKKRKTHKKTKVKYGYM